MDTFINDSYLLKDELAKKLYKDIKDLPIFDFHSHISLKEIYENKNFDSLTKAWLVNGKEGDHYKWRLLRALNVDEEYITGTKSEKEKMCTFLKSLPLMIGNPVYEWSHLEANNYLGFNGVFDGKNVEKTYEILNESIKNIKPQDILNKSKVEYLFTTDEPSSDLNIHNKINKDSSLSFKAIPTFRPDKFINIEKDDFLNGLKFNTFNQILNYLEDRIKYFKENGALSSDNGIDKKFIFTEFNLDDANDILKKKLDGIELTNKEISTYKGYILYSLSKLYYKYNLIMQLHIGPLRNNSKLQYENLGSDTGFDSIDDSFKISNLSNLFSELEYENTLPKAIVYVLNPKDYAPLISLAYSFKSSVNKIHIGAAWWFNDNYAGIYNSLENIANLGLLSEFLGMVTDSRSIFSYSRHDYFRRILCSYLSNLVKENRYPNDYELLKEVATSIAYKNAKEFFLGE